MRFLLGFLCALIFSGVATAQPVNTGHLTAELVTSAQGIAPGQTIDVALRQQIQKGWHTYWRNAGDSGSLRVSIRAPTFERRQICPRSASSPSEMSITDDATERSARPNVTRGSGYI